MFWTDQETLSISVLSVVQYISFARDMKIPTYIWRAIYDYDFL